MSWKSTVFGMFKYYPHTYKVWNSLQDIAKKSTDTSLICNNYKPWIYERRRRCSEIEKLMSRFRKYKSKELFISYITIYSCPWRLQESTKRGFYNVVRICQFLLKYITILPSVHITCTFYTQNRFFLRDRRIAIIVWLFFSFCFHGFSSM